jgi:3-hydroxybutyryl-CoA dehydrogenase
MSTTFQRIGVAGAGAMGRGIAQLYAQAGFPVVLFDTRPEAVTDALAQIGATFAMLAEKGRMTAAQASSATGNLICAQGLQSFADCDLVIEAVIERLDVKRELFQTLDAIVRPDAVIGTNTSSLSVTAIAAGSRHPQRVAGYHFFNPVPLMKIVEVIAGARTDPAVVERLCALARAAGHTPVVAQDTPGFIVNHAGRAFGTEALMIVGEGVADFATIDRIMREQVVFDGKGFRLGPFELMDLTGLDVSHPVMESIHAQYYGEPRFRPSVLAAQRVAGGLFGRKSNQGFYCYGEGSELPTEPAAPSQAPRPPVWVAPSAAKADLSALVADLGASVDHGARPGDDSLILLAPMGGDASSECAAHGVDARRAVAVDTLFPYGHRGCKRRTMMNTPATDPAFSLAAHALLATDGARVSILRDSAGFVAQRIVAMIVAIASEIAQQRIASPADIESAVRLGLGYPCGPLTMGDRLGADRVHAMLCALHATTGDPRYRPSGWLRRRAQLGLSLLASD